MSKNQSLFINIIHMSKFTFPCLSFQLFQLWTFRRVDFAVWNKFLFEYFPPTGKFPDWKLFLCYCLGASCSLPTLPWHFQKQRAKLSPSCTNPARDEPGSASTLVNTARFQLSARAVPIYRSWKQWIYIQQTQYANTMSITGTHRFKILK